MSAEIILPIHLANTEITPEEAAYNPERLVRLDSHLQDLILKKRLQCASYLLSRNDRIFAYKSMGKLAYYEDSPEMMPDSIRLIASITKAVTAIAVMKLVEDGRLYLEQAVSTLIQEFDTATHKEINIFHLLTHTSGICPDPGYLGEPYPRSWWNDVNDKDANEENNNWIKAILSGPAVSKPGEKWNYSSAGFMILGEIVSRLTGLPCEQYIIDKICRPIGMNDTFFDVPEKFHSRVCVTNEWGVKHLRQVEERTGKPPRTSGGLFSTLPDLNRLGQMLLNKGTYNGVRILGRKTVEAMIRNYLSGVPAYHWGGNIRDFKMGLGLSIMTGDLVTPGTFNHEGAGRSGLYIDPAEGLVAAYFTPSTHDWVPESVKSVKAIIWSGIL